MPVHTLAQETLQFQVLLAHRFAHGDQRATVRAHGVDILRRDDLEPLAAGADHINHHFVDHTTHDLVDAAARRQRGIRGAHAVKMPAHQRDFAQVFERDQAGAQTIVDIMVVVGNLIGEVGQLGLESGLLAIDEALTHIAEFARLGQGAVLEDAFATFKAEIQPGKIGVALLELIDHAQ